MLEFDLSIYYVFELQPDRFLHIYGFNRPDVNYLRKVDSFNYTDHMLTFSLHNYLYEFVPSLNYPTWTFDRAYKIK